MQFDDNKKHYMLIYRLHIFKSRLGN